MLSCIVASDSRIRRHISWLIIIGLLIGVQDTQHKKNLIDPRAKSPLMSRSVIRADRNIRLWPSLAVRGRNAI